MAEPPDTATVDGPARRRPSWSIKTIVENVAGVPIAELQDPERPIHPYVRAYLEHEARKSAPSARRAETVSDRADEVPDPVARVYPPLSGATGRALHGAEHEHHAETLARLRGDEGDGPGTTGHSPGPSRRPERIYLHYLLLHLDRLNDSALRYLKQAVDEELDHRAA